MLGSCSAQLGATHERARWKLTDAGRQLIASIVEPWQDWFNEALRRLSDAERADLYRLLVKGSGLWDDVWPAEPNNR
jgi:DNA-binding MarR family transcriptional regulator